VCLSLTAGPGGKPHGASLEVGVGRGIVGVACRRSGEPSYNTGTAATNADLETAPTTCSRSRTVISGPAPSRAGRLRLETSGSKTAAPDGPYAGFSHSSSSSRLACALDAVDPDQRPRARLRHLLHLHVPLLGLKVYALTGANYETSALLKDDKKNSLGS
jgi:hypothetical protein